MRAPRGLLMGGRGRRSRLSTGLALELAFAVSSAPVRLLAQPAMAEPAPSGVKLDAVAVRFSAPETGGPVSPRFVFERELAFEARLEALADPRWSKLDRFAEQHVRAALERHIGEVLLASLAIDPAPSLTEVERRVARTRQALIWSVGGDAALQAALEGELLGPADLARILSRRARASLYLDRMVRPQPEPPRTQLRALWRSGPTPFTGRPFKEIRESMIGWYLSERAGSDARAFYASARGRVALAWLRRPQYALPAASAR